MTDIATLRSTFDRHYDATERKLPFCEDYATPPGGLGLLTHVQFGLKDGEIASMQVAHNHRILLVGSILGNFAVSARLILGIKRGKVSSETFEVLGIAPSALHTLLPLYSAQLNGALDKDSLRCMLGSDANDPSVENHPNIGQLIKRLVDKLPQIDIAHRNVLNAHVLFSDHWAAATEIPFSQEFGTPENGFAGLIRADLGYGFNTVVRTYTGATYGHRILATPTPYGNIIAYEPRIGADGAFPAGRKITINAPKRLLVGPFLALVRLRPPTGRLIAKVFGAYPGETTLGSRMASHMAAGTEKSEKLAKKGKGKKKKSKK